MDYGTDLMGPIQKIEGGIHGGQNAQTVEGDQVYIENQNNTVIMATENAPKKIWEYILSYILVFFVGAFFIMLLGVAYIALISGKFQTVNQKALTFMGIVFFGFVTASVVHWLIKLPNLRQQRRDTN